MDAVLVSLFELVEAPYHVHTADENNCHALCSMRQQKLDKLYFAGDIRYFVPG